MANGDDQGRGETPEAVEALIVALTSVLMHADARNIDLGGAGSTARTALEAIRPGSIARLERLRN